MRGGDFVGKVDSFFFVETRSKKDKEEKWNLWNKAYLSKENAERYNYYANDCNHETRVVEFRRVEPTEKEN